MGPLLCAFALLGQEPNPPLRAKTNVPLVVFEGTDAREAFRWLFRQGLFGGTVAPDVQGQITVRLVNVPWEVALQQIARQVDATYRFEHGFVEVVRRDASEPLREVPQTWPPLGLRQEIESGYRWLRYKVALGKGDEIAAWVDAAARDEKVRGRDPEDAVDYRALVDNERANPSFSIVAFNRGSPGKERDEGVKWLSVDVAYASPKGQKTLFNDLWSREGAGPWRLARRRSESLRFVDADVRDVLHAFFRRSGGAYSIDPAVRGKMTLDLTGLPFEVAVSKILRTLNATYVIDGGVYRIVPLPENSRPL